MALQYDLLEPGLALSAMPRSASDLADAPFAAILNVCDFGAPRYARGLRPDIELVRRPINDEYPVPLPSLILATLELADLRQRGLTTLVHCHAGQSRSPSIIALYWMARDGLTWEEAVGRVRARRDIVEPNRFFATDRRRDSIMRPVRAFLAGNAALLDAARQRRDDMVRSLQQREADPADRDDGWNLIESGLALGNMAASTDGIIEHGIRTIILVGDIGEGDAGMRVKDGAMLRVHRLPPSALDDASLVSGVLKEIGSGRSGNQGVAILSPGDEAAGMFVMCAYLMLDRGWDVAAAMWYVGSRRAALWPHTDMLWSADWDSLLGRQR
jgi:hypothetical protein